MSNFYCHPGRAGGPPLVVRLDAMLRDVTARGIWVSAHPDIILKMGVKQVLYRTKRLGWGTDTHLYRDVRALREAFPPRLQSAGPRVLKQNRGNGGQGVWKVEAVSRLVREGAIVRVLHARRGSVPEDLALGDFMERCEAYFAANGCIVDQPFQPRLPDGMIRCYMGVDRVIGFGHQLIKALIPPPPEGPDSEAPSRVLASCTQRRRRNFKHSGQRWNRSGHRR